MTGGNQNKNTDGRCINDIERKKGCENIFDESNPKQPMMISAAIGIRRRISGVTSIPIHSKFWQNHTHSQVIEPPAGIA